MRFLTTVTLSLLNLFSYGQSFNISIDTLKVSISQLIKPAVKVDLTHAVKFQDSYCCFFEESKKVNSRQDLKFCFIISDKGKVLQKIEVPNQIQDSYYFDLFLANDTIFLKPYMDSETFFLTGDKSKWKESHETDDMIFEDERFYFTYLDFGEWGSTTWCKDKQTGKEYELASSGEIINKIDNVYYITSNLKILKVENPLSLKQCDKDYYYEVVRTKKIQEGTNSVKGAQVLFSDTTYSQWEQKEPKLNIATSFIADNKLYHLCTDSTKTFIAQLENGIMKPVQLISKKLSIFDWYYSYRNKIQSDGSQLLKFKSKNKFGLIEVKGVSINMHYLTLI